MVSLLAVTQLKRTDSSVSVLVDKPRNVRHVSLEIVVLMFSTEPTSQDAAGS